MIVSLLAFLLALSPQNNPGQASPYVVSVINEMVGDDMVVRFVLSGPPSSYSAGREGDDIVVRIAARAVGGLSLPVAKEPIKALVLTSTTEFEARVTLTENRTYEMVRDVSSLRLILKSPTPTEAPVVSSPAKAATPDASPSPSAERAPDRNPDPTAVDTADLYRRLFPTTADAGAIGPGPTEIGKQESWYSNFRWLGIQMRPWLSVTYVDGKTTEVETNTVSADSYWVIQPNLGLGFSPHIGSGGGEGNGGEGKWKVNYTPRFRRRGNMNLPRLTSHFIDAGLDQPIVSLGALYGNFHFSKGILETDEVDAGREYGIGLNRVLDSSLQNFRRTSVGVGVRFDTIANTEADVSAGKTKVRYGDSAGATAGFGERAFFDYDARNLNASLKRRLGESRFLNLAFTVHDTPNQKERKQVEGRGYTYSASVEGDIAALTTGRLLFGYRTQKSPNAGKGGQNYKDITYGALLTRELSEATTVGLSADRRLYLSAYAENGFYVADALKGDLNTRIPLQIFLRGSAGLQANNYKASPQTNDGSTLVLRRDKIKLWSIGLSRSVTNWLFLRLDYTSENRDSNLDRFDIKSRALTIQLGLGFFGRGGNQAQPAW